MAIKTNALVIALAGSLSVELATGQTVSPQETMNRLLQQEALKLQQRFEDQQRERRRQQQQLAYDSRMCAAVGYQIGTPDHDQCVRDSAAYRRGDTTTHFQQRPLSDCVVFADGDGGGIVDCN